MDTPTLKRIMSLLATLRLDYRVGGGPSNDKVVNIPSYGTIILVDEEACVVSDFRGRTTLLPVSELLNDLTRTFKDN